VNFQVPQFIEVEDKIFGPLSFKQFLYVVGGGGLGYIVYTFQIIPFYLRLIPIIIAVGFGLALAFYKVNDRPFVNALETGLRYYTRKHLYLWKKTNQTIAKKTETPGITEDKGLFVPQLSESKLKDLSWSLDVNEKVK
jgi:hypothetical protein